MDVDASDLLGGVMVSMQWLVAQLAGARAAEPSEVIVELREWLDRDLDGGTPEP